MRTKLADHVFVQDNIRRTLPDGLPTILRRAHMGVPKLNLNRARQPSNLKTASVCVAAPISAVDVWTDHFSHHSATFKKVVDRIFLVIFFGERLARLCARSLLLRLAARDCPLD